MNFAPVLPPLVGGTLIGLASVLLVLGIGRIAGVSGIAFGMLNRANWRPESLWRAGFVLGLLAAGASWSAASGHPMAPARTLSVPWLVLSGLLVGWGTSLGSGCTSGHGVSGLGRLSLRSLVAVLTFMACGMATVYVVRHLLTH